MKDFNKKGRDFAETVQDVVRNILTRKLKEINNPDDELKFINGFTERFGKWVANRDYL
jgi:hypothetical protein